MLTTARCRHAVARQLSQNDHCTAALVPVMLSSGFGAGRADDAARGRCRETVAATIMDRMTDIETALLAVHLAATAGMMG